MPKPISWPAQSRVVYLRRARTRLLNHLPTSNRLWQPTSTQRPAGLCPASPWKQELTQLRVSTTDTTSGEIPRKAAHPVFNTSFSDFVGEASPWHLLRAVPPPLANGSAPRNAPRTWRQPRPGHRCRAARRLRLTPQLSSHSATVSGDYGQPAKQSGAESPSATAPADTATAPQTKRRSPAVGSAALPTARRPSARGMR